MLYLNKNRNLKMVYYQPPTKDDRVIFYPTGEEFCINMNIKIIADTGVCTLLDGNKVWEYDETGREWFAAKPLVQIDLAKGIITSSIRINRTEYSDIQWQAPISSLFRNQWFTLTLSYGECKYENISLHSLYINEDLVANNYVDKNKDQYKFDLDYNAIHDLSLGKMEHEILLDYIKMSNRSLYNMSAKRIFELVYDIDEINYYTLYDRNGSQHQWQVIGDRNEPLFIDSEKTLNLSKELKLSDDVIEDAPTIKYGAIMEYNALYTNLGQSQLFSPVLPEKGLRLINLDHQFYFRMDTNANFNLNYSYLDSYSDYALCFIITKQQLTMKYLNADLMQEEHIIKWDLSNDIYNIKINLDEQNYLYITLKNFNDIVILDNRWDLKSRASAETLKDMSMTHVFSLNFNSSEDLFSYDLFLADMSLNYGLNNSDFNGMYKNSMAEISLGNQFSNQNEDNNIHSLYIINANNTSTISQRLKGAIINRNSLKVIDNYPDLGSNLRLNCKITTAGRTKLASLFFNDASMYIGIGATKDWSIITSNQFDDENIPTAPYDARYDIGDWALMLRVNNKKYVKESEKGSISYNNKKWSLVDSTKIYTEQCHHVMLTVNISNLQNIDALKQLTFRKIGLFSHVYDLPDEKIVDDTVDPQKYLIEMLYYMQPLVISDKVLNNLVIIKPF